MQFLAWLFIGKPLSILAAAALFFAGYLTLRFTSLGKGRRPRPLLWVAVLWTLYALWEWLVLARTPDANIRVDLMPIWPILLIVSVWLTIRALK